MTQRAQRSEMDERESKKAKPQPVSFYFLNKFEDS